MDMRDPHLEKALQHAPDRELQPQDELRQRVLAYAEDAAKPAKPAWLARLADCMRQWQVTPVQLGGMSSIAVALLVLLMVHEQRPQDSEWAHVAADTAVAQADALQKAAPAEAEIYTGDQNKLQAPTPSSVETATSPEAFTEHAMRQEAESEHKEDAATTDNTAPVAPSAEAPAGLPAEQMDEAAAEALTLEDAPATSNLRSEAKTKMEALAKYRNGDAVKEPDEAILKETLIARGGKAVAERDIQAGVLRLLSIEGPSGERCEEPIPQAPQIDADTGYSIEVLDVCVVPVALVDEVEAYNQTMRAHQRRSSQ